MSIQKIINLGGKTTANPPLPSLITSMKAGQGPGKSSEMGATPSLYNSMRIGKGPEKSKQAPNQKVIDTMISKGGKTR